MPLIRLNARDDRLDLHGVTKDPVATLEAADIGRGPIVVMLHGYRYRPGHSEHCPHTSIMAFAPRQASFKICSWPGALGFGTADPDEGLAIAFGWDARGALWSAQRRIPAAGRALATAISVLHTRHPQRPVHILAHSMGTGVAMEALRLLPPGAVGRIISMTGACYQGTAQAALDSPAGRTAELVNIVSRENDAFDFLFERLVAPPARGDRAIGHGIDAPNAVTVQIDCPETLAHLDRIGLPVAAPRKRICHWSAYTRPGVMRAYAALLRRPRDFPLDLLRQGLPGPAPRWSRLLPRPANATPLPFLANPS